MMKNKLAAVLLFLFILVFSLPACGKTNEAAAAGSRQSSTEAAQRVTKTESEQKKSMESSAPQQSAAEAATAAAAKAENPASGKILVAYFSATGTTKPIAGLAAEVLGADLYEIVPKTLYTAADLNYNDSSSRATVEQNDASARPEISGSVDNMEQYDTVIIGYPIWWGKEPKIIDTFVESYDFKGKTMTTLCTSGGSGIEKSASDIQAAVSDVTWLKSRRFPAGAGQKEVQQWLQEIGLIK